MHAVPQARRSMTARLVHFLVLLLPAILLGWMAFENNSFTLYGVAVAFGLISLILINAPVAWRPPTSGPVLFGYLIALSVVYWFSRNEINSTSHACRGALLLSAVVLMAGHDLFRTGAEPRRRAKKWCARLQARQHWPSDPLEIRNLSEVYALHDALQVEPGPVFNLFRDPRPEVRAAAFAAFIGRKRWRARESAAVLDAARKTPEPQVRVMAVAALGSIDDPAVTAGLTEFYHDSSAEVRAAAVWVSLAENGQRWAMVRDALRAMLSNPNATDKALPGAAGALPVIAICDLTAWAAEPEPLGLRSVRTLIEHYSCLLQTTADYDLITELTNQVLDPATSTVLRVELANLLRNLNLLTPELLDRMSNADQPAPVRLLAAEAMLTADPLHPDGLDVLRGLGRQPNREMGLTIAAILQNQLAIDLGLPANGLSPNSKQAGEVVKRVMAWAVARVGDRRNATPTPGQLGSHPPMVPETPAPSEPPLLHIPKLGSARQNPW